MADKSVTLSGNTWRETKRRFTITPQTHLEFDFASDGKGEMQGIGLDENPLASSDRIFKLAGSQRWGIRDFNYTGAGATQLFSIPVGQYYTGSKLRLVLVNDNDSSSQEDGESTFSNVRLCEGPCPSRDVASITQELYFVHNDHLGTPKLMTGRNQEAVWSANSTPYGVLINEESSIGAENSRFIGQYFDVATGLHYNYFRDYDPTLGRYVQSDPIGLSGGINTYAYVDGNPVSLVDPSGLAACYVNFPDYPISYAPGKTTTWVGGHSGVMGYDENGGTRYYEYGRYGSNGKYGEIIGERLSGNEGNVKRVPIPDLEMGDDGSPTPESWAALEKALSKKAGKSTEADFECDEKSDEDKVYEYMEKFANNKKRDRYSWNPFNSNHCRSVADDAFEAGKPKTTWW